MTMTAGEPRERQTQITAINQDKFKIIGSIRNLFDQVYHNKLDRGMLRGLQCRPEIITEFSSDLFSPSHRYKKIKAGRERDYSLR